VGTVGKMPMSRQVRTGSLSFFSLRPCAFALFSFSLLLFAAFAGYPPKTEAILSSLSFLCSLRSGEYNELHTHAKMRRVK